jgi:hypothetical protein
VKLDSAATKKIVAGEMAKPNAREMQSSYSSSGAVQYRLLEI